MATEKGRRISLTRTQHEVRQPHGEHERGGEGRCHDRDQPKEVIARLDLGAFGGDAASRVPPHSMRQETRPDDEPECQRVGKMKQPVVLGRAYPRHGNKIDQLVYQAQQRAGDQGNPGRISIQDVWPEIKQNESRDPGSHNEIPVHCGDLNVENTFQIQRTYKKVGRENRCFSD